MPAVPPLVITDAERAELQRRVRAHTTRQRAVKRARIVLLAAEGVPNRQIAETLFISPKTATVHVSNILGKLGVHGRIEAATIAHRLGIIKPGS